MAGKQFATQNRARAKGFQTNDTVAHGYYVFNTVENNGFVIIASDDRMPEVLGYSERGSLDPKTAPCNVKWLLDYYDKAAANIRQVGAKARAVSRASKPDVRPLITTTWDQGAPYNDQCPEYNGARCITGCVATAMAQVINYNRWPQGQTKGVPAYTTATAQISVPELGPTQFDWDNMTNDDIARLMRYCGQSVKMDYGLNDSGAFPTDEASALVKVFGYSQTAHYAENANYSEEDWEDLLYNELAEQRPIVYNGWGTGGGHTFVVHGYREGHFYINWGWSGNEDGYFKLTGLNTGIGDFNDAQSATIGIQPPAGADVSRPMVVVKSMNFYGSEKFFFRNESNAFSVNVNGTLVSDLAEQKTLSIGLGLYDKDGMKKVLWEDGHDFPVGEDFWFDAHFDIGDDVANGEYRIVPICRYDENDSWKSDANSSDFYLMATITDKYLKMQAYPLNSQERNTEDHGVDTIDGITYYFYSYKGMVRAMVLPKDGGTYAGDLYVPDNVDWQGTVYKVYKADYNAFQNCHELTSLSVGMRISPNIWGCEHLKKIELREGVAEVSNIGYCSLLESINYPKSATLIQGAVNGCQNLKTIRFNNPRQFSFGQNPYWGNGSMPSLTDIYFVSPDAPTIQWKDGNMDIHPSVTIHVPQGCKAGYEAGDWKGWNIVEDLPMPEVDGVEWGYCDGNKVTGGGIVDQVAGNDCEYAIHVPSAMLEAYKGKTISSIQVYMSSEYDYVFITKPGTDYLVKQPVEGAYGIWEEVTLSEPYTITGDELFVGMGHKGLISSALAEDITENDGLWFRTMGTNDSGTEPGEWICIPEQAPDYAHPIPVRFVITGGDMPADAVLRDVSLTPVDNRNYIVNAKVVNRLTSQLKKVTINWDFDGKNNGSKTFDLDLRPGQGELLSFDVNATLTDRNNNFNYVLTAVNDVTDAIPANSTGTFNFNTSANTYYPRRVVMEEATGTWCGWCVRGIETIDRLKQQYPENFIAIGLHDNDEMSNFVNYGVIAKNFNSYPSCLINRTKLMNPALPLVQPMVEEMKDKAEAKVSATAVYAKRDNSAVTVNTESVFGFSDDKTADYRLAYALVEDHVGPYVQSNYYSGMTLDDEQAFMEEWTKKDAKVKIEFNDVARGLFGGEYGVEGSVPKQVKEGEVYKYAYSFPLPSNVSNHENLRIVVMLIDQRSGEIINACETSIACDQAIENQVFTFTDNGKSILDGETVTYSAEISESGIVGDCGTNVEADKDGLMIKAYESKLLEGTAKLEILRNGISPQEFIWTMGGTSESILDKTTIEKTFKTDAKGELKIGLTAGQLQSFGQLEARLTVTIGSQTEHVNIVLVNEKPVVGNITVNSDQVWWCNHDNRDNAKHGGLGTGVAEHMLAAIHIPFDMIGGKGTTIDGFCFRSSGAAMENVSVWIATKLPDNENATDMEVIKIPAKQLKQFGMIEVPFSQAYEIPENGLYVGYSFDITDPSLPGGSYPLEYTSSDTNRKGGFWVKSDGNPKWIDMGLKYGNLLAKVLFGGGTFKHYAVSMSDMSPVAALIGNSGTTRMWLSNEGADTVEKLTIEVKGSDGSVSTSTVNTYIEPYSESIINFNLKADQVPGADMKTITITKVNDHDNAPSGSEAGKLRLFTVQNKPSYTPVFETVSGTGLWGSIRAPFVSKELDKTFGSKIIQIYPHIDDVMEIEDYSEVTDTLNILEMYVNRGEYVDSYYGTNWQQWGIKDYIRETLKTVAPGSINVSAEWTDEDKYHLDIHTETMFEMSFDDNPFQIGYVLLEDGLHGTGNQWNQANQYAGIDIDEPFFLQMAVLPSRVPDLKFDNIPVAAWGAYKGIAGSLPENIVANDKNSHTYSVDIFGNMLIQNKENLSIVALLLDKQTGKIFNAAKFRLGEGTPDEPDPQDDNDFEFRYCSNSIENGGTVTIMAEEDSFGFGELNCETNPSSNPKNGLVLVTKDGSKQSGTATISILSNKLDPGNIQWCMGGECVPMNGKSSLTKSFTTDDDGVCLVMFDATKIQSEGMLEAKLTATIGSETQTVYIKFVYEKPAPQGNMEFRYGGKALEDGATVIINAEDSWGFGELNCETNPSSNPKDGLILVSRAAEQSGTARLEILNNTLNPGMIQWCMGGECVPMNNKSQLEKSFTTDKDSVCLVMFDATNIKSDGELNAKLTATISGDTRIVNIKFICDKANGISVIYSEDDNAVWYDMNGTRLENAPKQKGVYIRNGKKVVKQQ